MDSDETLTSQSQFSSSVQLMEDVSLEDIMSCEGGYDHDHNMMQNHQHLQKYISSRLSSCSSFSNGQVTDQGGGNPDYFDHVGYTSMHSLHSMSRLSIESFDGGADADEELSDDNKDKGKFIMGFSSDSEHEEVISYSLPATPPRKRTTGPRTQQRLMTARKDYGSETDAQKSALDGGQKMRYYKKPKSKRSSRKNSMVDDSMAVAANKGKGLGGDEGNDGGYFSNSVAHMSLSANNSSHAHSGGESEGSGLMVITKPKGGNRSICMDIEEVKACRELGFELEHERMLEMPSRLSISVSNLDTSSGGNSPIASWRISSPGDDPREVKARLKVWAQAVAISSTSKPSN